MVCIEREDRAGSPAVSRPLLRARLPLRGSFLTLEKTAAAQVRNPEKMQPRERLLREETSLWRPTNDDILGREPKACWGTMGRAYVSVRTGVQRL